MVLSEFKKVPVYVAQVKIQPPLPSAVDDF